MRCYHLQGKKAYGKRLFIMSFFSWIWGKRSGAAATPPAATPLKRLLAGGDNYALKVSAVYSAVKLIAESIAQLPCELQIYNAPRKFFEGWRDNGLFALLALKPNERQTAFEFWRAAVAQILLQGNAYIVPRYTQRGDVAELILCAPGAVRHDVYGKRYVVTDVLNGVNGVFAPDEIVHLRNIGVDGGHSGVSTISQAGNALGIARLAEQSIAEGLSNGGLVRGMISGAGGALPTMGGVTRKQSHDIADDIAEQLQNGKQIVSVPSEVKLQPLSLTPADARILENEQMSIREIARFFRVHPELLYESTNNTYKSSEVPNVMFLHQTLAPILKQIEDELLTKLIPRSLWGKVRMHFDREAMYLTDLGAEVQYIKGTLEAGVYTVNDWRAKKSLPSVAGGDELLVSANLKTLKALVSEGESSGERKEN